MAAMRTIVNRRVAPSLFWLFSFASLLYVHLLSAISHDTILLRLDDPYLHFAAFNRREPPMSPVALPALFLLPTISEQVASGW
jgi:hypothetical protein